MLTDAELLYLYGLRSLNRLEPATISELISGIRAQASAAGVLPSGQIAKIDHVLGARDMIATWERAEPPLAVQVEYEPSELSPTGNVLPHAESRFSLTEEGEQEMRRLERHGGVLE